jgi:arsenite methyltransferase
MNDQLREEVREHYAAAATRNGGCCGFDSTTGVLSLGSGDPIAVADLQPGERVLDLGSGAGPDVIRAAEQVGPEGVVWGLDMTDEMLALAQRNIAEAGLRNAHFLKGEIESVPLPAESVDIVLSNCVINLSTDKPAVFAELARVLAPGGRVAVSDIVAEDQLAPNDRAERGSYCGCIAGALSKSEYEQLLAGAGLEDVSVEFTHEAAEGMHGAIIRATKPEGVREPEAVAAGSGGGCC